MLNRPIRMILLMFAALGTGAWCSWGTTGENSLGLARSIRNPLRDPPAAATGDGELLGRLQAELRGPDRGRAVAAAYRLPECGSAGATALVQLLQQPDAMDLQFAALDSLVAMGEAAVPAVTEWLRSNHGNESGSPFDWHVLHRLGTEAQAAVPTVLSLLQDPTSPMNDRLAAAEFLGSLRTDAGATREVLLRFALTEQDTQLRFQCLTAVRELGSLDAGSQTRLGQLMTSNDEELRLRVAAAAVLVQQSPVSPLLLPTLVELVHQAEEWESVANAVQALGKLGKEAAIATPALTCLLQHESTDVQLAAIIACGEIGAVRRKRFPSSLPACRKLAITPSRKQRPGLCCKSNRRRRTTSLGFFRIRKPVWRTCSLA